MRWRSVIGFLPVRSFGSPWASKPSSACGAARSGSTLPIGASSESLPCSTQLHGAGRRDRLGHRGDPEHAVGCRGVVFGQVAFAVRALIDYLLAVRGHCDHAGNLLGLAFLTQELIDLSLILHGVTSRLFFKGRRSSSRPPLPASRLQRSGRAVAMAA